MKHIALALTLLALTFVTVSADDIGPVPRPIPYNSPRPAPTNGVELVGFDGQNFRYAITLTGSNSNTDAAPDCYGKAVIALCGRYVTGVTGLPATWNSTGVTITGAPVGVSYVTVTTNQPMNANQVAWEMIVDDDRSYTGTTSGPRCNATAVALSGLASAAEIDGIQARDIVLLVLIACAVLLVRWALKERKQGN